MNQESQSMKEWGVSFEAKKFAVLQSENRWIPSNTVEIDTPEKARSLLKLMDALEDLDDVQSVTANFEMAEELMSLSMV